jgi:uncharacterized membrane protein
MPWLVLGVAIFIGTHLIPSVPKLRQAARDRVGAKAYQGLYSLAALIGLVLIVVGMGRAAFIPIWNPVPGGRTAAIYGMPLALILFIGAYMPSNLKRLTRHPMLWGVTLWAGLHLLANGDLASLILFGTFGLYSLFDMWSANRRGATLSKTVYPLWRDAALVAAGLVVYVALLYAHGWLFGPAIV